MAKVKALQEKIEKIEERRASLPPGREIRIWMDGTLHCMASYSSVEQSLDSHICSMLLC
jgi:hypothetical protein